MSILRDDHFTPREYVTCNLCGADATRPWGRKHGIQIVQCKTCGLVYANPRLDAEQRKQYYGAAYFSAENSNRTSLPAATESQEDLHRHGLS